MLGIVSDEDFDAELIDDSQNHNRDSVKVVEKPSRGRGDSNNLPDSLRKIIGEDAAINGSKDAIEAFGVSKSSVAAYKNGATSCATYDEKKPDLLAHINKGKERAIKSASNKMRLALSHITPEKLEGAKAKDLAGIAKDMSAMIRNLEPEKEESNKQVNFIFYGPKERAINTYSEIILDEG